MAAEDVDEGSVDETLCKKHGLLGNDACQKLEKRASENLNENECL